MAVVFSAIKTLFTGGKKPQGPSPELIRLQRVGASREREAEKRLREEEAARLRRGLTSGRNILLSAASGGIAGTGGAFLGGGGGGSGATGSGDSGTGAGGGPLGGGFTPPPGGPAGGGPQF